GNGAEIFAAALQGNGRARLVGELTAGMASVQHLVRLQEGYGLWLTYEQYVQKDGTPIFEHSLRPDLHVDTPVVGFAQTPPTTEAALGRAVDEWKQVEQAGTGPVAAAPTPAAARQAPGAAGSPKPSDTTRPAGQ